MPLAPWLWALWSLSVHSETSPSPDCEAMQTGARTGVPAFDVPVDGACPGFSLVPVIRGVRAASRCSRSSFPAFSLPVRLGREVEVDLFFLFLFAVFQISRARAWPLGDDAVFGSRFLQLDA